MHCQLANSVFLFVAAGHYVHAEIARMFWQILVDPAIPMDTAITEKIAAEAGQPVLHVDCMGK